MLWTDEHIQWLQDTGNTLILECGRQVKVFRFHHEVSDQVKMTQSAIGKECVHHITIIQRTGQKSRTQTP
ncbi:hypothetical protein [Xenorhabdus santafensis]|uniref:hypothetical protein n=1 Tax=Xenorhabdus santafensis TaxID=2582833 RepID=UPI0029E7F732|nr:hypothetical protein [Xenorhabdus sp. 12]